MKERRIITSFALANATDIMLTRIGLALNATEIGASAEVVNSGKLESAAIAKIALTVGLIGVYALAHQTGNERFRWSTEKTMQIANVLIWAVQVWNVVNIAAELTAH